MSASEWRIEPAEWPRDEGELMAVRRAVFVEEQGVPEELEREARDAEAWHLLARASGGEPVGTARLLSDGKIGRMAVLPAWRRRGIGARLLAGTIDIARSRGMNAVYLHAQCRAVPFYERAGFTVYGDVFDEAGIPHRAMRRHLDETT